MFHSLIVYKKFFRINLMRALSYRRSRFWLYMFLTGLESFTIYILYAILFQHVNEIAGWTYDDILVLIGVFMLTNSLSWILFKSGAGKLDVLIKRGDLDWLLVKPVDTQYLVTISRMDFEDAGRSVVGVFLMFAGLQNAPLFETLVRLPVFIIAIFAGQAVMYSILFAIKCVSFKSIEGWSTNAISWRFQDLARYPTDIYTGIGKFFFSFIMPLIFIVTVPTKLLTREFDILLFSGSLLAAMATLAVARLIWKFSLKGYTSASS